MPDELLTLGELSDLSGVEVRTLRSWIAQGVVPGAETAGRNARYVRATLTRARAVKAMRELYGMSLPAIRQDLLTADEAKIEAYAALAEPTRPVDSDEASYGSESSARSAPPAGTSAADYLRRLRGAGVFGTHSPESGIRPPLRGARLFASPSAPGAAQQQGSRLARLAEALEQIGGARLSRRRTKGDVRLHIPITPDLELTVRGDHTPEEIARYEQIADLLRAILTGGLER